MPKIYPMQSKLEAETHPHSNQQIVGFHSIDRMQSGVMQQSVFDAASRFRGAPPGVTVNPDMQDMPPMHKEQLGLQMQKQFYDDRLQNAPNHDFNQAGFADRIAPGQIPG